MQSPDTSHLVWSGTLGAQWAVPTSRPHVDHTKTTSTLLEDHLRTTLKSTRGPPEDHYYNGATCISDGNSFLKVKPNHM